MSFLSFLKTMQRYAESFAKQTGSELGDPTSVYLGHISNLPSGELT